MDEERHCAASTEDFRQVGFRVTAYDARHSWATEALMSGGVDPISVALLMGHKDTTMVSRVSSHLAKTPEFLRQQARKASEKTNSLIVSTLITGFASAGVLFVSRSPVGGNETRTVKPDPTLQTPGVGGRVVDKSPGSHHPVERASEQWFDQIDIMRRSTVDLQTQRQTMSIGEQYGLRAFATLGFANLQAPFFAGQNVASPRSVVVSSPSICRHNSRIDVHARRKAPDSVQCLNRLQQVV
ncbi:hypothetical protein [Rubinisphaera margarita]|nr:hypothetical protein [Rubinisphaera margarita]MCG6154627.1 hypothetical protein [Rubinisphaera margarita]